MLEARGGNSESCPLEEWESDQSTSPQFHCLPALRVPLGFAVVHLECYFWGGGQACISPDQDAQSRWEVGFKCGQGFAGRV